MRARKFRKRIEIYQLTNVPDGFGGNTISESLLGESWCDITTVSGVDVTEFGINNTQLVVEITTRKRSDLNYNTINQLIKYKGENYTIISFPTDQDYEGSFIRFLAVKEQDKSV